MPFASVDISTSDAQERGSCTVPRQVFLILPIYFLGKSFSGFTANSPMPRLCAKYMLWASTMEAFLPSFTPLTTNKPVNSLNTMDVDISSFQGTKILMTRGSVKMYLQGFATSTHQSHTRQLVIGMGIIPASGRCRAKNSLLG